VSGTGNSAHAALVPAPVPAVVPAAVKRFPAARRIGVEVWAKCRTLRGSAKKLSQSGKKIEIIVDPVGI